MKYGHNQLLLMTDMELLEIFKNHTIEYKTAKGKEIFVVGSFKETPFSNDSKHRFCSFISTEGKSFSLGVEDLSVTILD